MVISSTKYRFV